MDQVLLSWLVEERNNPTPSFTGGGGGTIDSGYIQLKSLRHLVMKLSRVLDLLASSLNSNPKASEMPSIWLLGEWAISVK